MVAHTIYSDDHGATWKLGGNAARHTNECAVAELADGRAMLNARDWSSPRPHTQCTPHTVHSRSVHG